MFLHRKQQVFAVGMNSNDVAYLIRLPYDAQTIIYSISNVG